MEPFKTLKNETFAEFVEKKSKFLCYANHAESKNEAESYINSIKTKHWDAKHNVYAYRLRGNICKFSDDGEPQRTAGFPVFSILEKLNIIDTVIVVTRYFGGILLGANGLVRAYSHVAGLAIEQGEIAEMVPGVIAKIKVTYEAFSKIQRMVKDFNAKLFDLTYTDFVEARLAIEENKFEEIKKFIVEASNGDAYLVIENKDFLYI